MHDVRRAFSIKDALEEFADGKLDLDAKDCEHFEDREKVAIGGTASVVVYYDLTGDTMQMIGGMVIHPRVA